jgi:hypothetical protein
MEPRLENGVHSCFFPIGETGYSVVGKGNLKHYAIMKAEGRSMFLGCYGVTMEDLISVDSMGIEEKVIEGLEYRELNLRLQIRLQTGEWERRSQ